MLEGVEAAIAICEQERLDILGWVFCPLGDRTYGI